MEEKQNVLMETAAPADLGLVSVIVPVYNVEGYLRPCVQSVLAQTYPHFELLLVDDGSTDSSPAICDEFAAMDSRVRVIHKENQGPSATRNRGIEESRGDFIAFVDSDDLIHKEMLEKMVTAVTRYQTDLGICGYERFRDNWKQPSRISPYSLVIFQSLSELASVYTKPATNMFGVSIWAKLYRAEIIRKNNIRFREDINYEEDCVFNLDYFRHVTTTAVLRDYFYSYRQMDVSLSKGYRKNSFQFLVNGFRGRIALLKELGMSIAGAESILVIVVKNTLLKIYDSDLPKEEKFAEYNMVMSFAESQTVCAKATKSPNRLTRTLAQAVTNKDAKKVHRILQMSKITDKLKGIAKKILRRG